MGIRRKSALLLAALVIAVGIFTSAMSAFPAAAPGQPRETPEYTVASGGIKAGAKVAAQAPGAFADGLSEKLILVGVGTLLLGLAAAVRRTA